MARSFDNHEDIMSYESREQFELQNSTSFIEGAMSYESRELDFRHSNFAEGDISMGDLPPMADEKKSESETESPPTEPKKIAFRRMLSCADWIDWVLMLFGSIGGFSHGLLLASVFVTLASAFRSLAENLNNPVAIANALNQIAIVFLILALLLQVTVFFEQGCWMYTGERQASKLRRHFLQATLSQDVGYFDTEANTAALMTIISSDISVVQDAIEKIGHCLCFTTTFFASFILAVYYCWQLGLCTLVVVPLIATTGGISNALMVNFAKKTDEAYVNADSIVEQTVSQIRTVYSYVGEMKAVQAFSVALGNTLKHGEKQGFAKGLGLGSLYSVLYMSWGFLFWFGAVLVVSDKVKGFNVIISAFCMIFGGICLGMAAPDFQHFEQAKMAGAKIFDILDRVPSVRDCENPKTPSGTMRGRLELRDVHFAYPSRPDALIFNGLNLEIPEGRSMALVGGSGSGKSTVVSLLERFYDPNQGQVLIDGTDIRTLKLQWIRSQMGLVGQEPALFATTIKENILLGRPEASMDEVEAAAKAANAHLFISALPLGYETQVGDRGTQLSGGQKQRLAIARAVLKNPAILMLDEATSALDATSEHAVQEALDALMVGRTSVIVAHRLSTIKDVDCIAVLNKGQIVEMGNHNQLIARGPSGAYFALVQLQTGQDTDKVKMKEIGRSPRTRLGTPRHSISSPGTVHLALSGLSPAMSPARMSYMSPSYMSPSYMSPSFMPATNEIEEESFYAQEEEKAPASAVIQGRSKSSVLRLVKLSLPFWKELLLGCIGAVASGGLTPTFAYIMVSAGVELFAPKDEIQNKVNFWVYLFLGLGSAAIFTNLLQHYFFHKVGELTTRTVREETFMAMVENEVGWFDRDENSSSALAARLATDAAQVKNAIGDHGASVVYNSSSLIIAAVLALSSDWKMTLVGLALIPFIVSAGVMMGKSMSGFSGELKKSHLKAIRFAGEAVTNVKTVASFTAEARIIEKLNETLEEPLRKGFTEGVKQGFLYGASQAACQLSNAIALYYAASAIRHGHTTFLASFRAFEVLSHTSHGLSELLALVPAFVKAIESISSIFDIIDRPTEIEPDSEDSKKPVEMKGFIEFRGVEFRYPSRPDVIVLSNFNLKIAAGKTVALVGASGSGKSSTISLIERFYDPQVGHVLIDGKDIKYINLRWLRKRVALVQQEPALFGTSIKENILYGNEKATEQEVVAAARAANAHTFISGLPDAYNTNVGDRGSQLSGGQKQRIAIARAILKNPSILLLDEATSALDLESERVVQEALDKLMTTSARTTIVIAHRLSTVRDAHTIAVMNKGVIVEKGSHMSLLQRRGAYAALVASQTGH